MRRQTVEHPFATIKYRIFGHPRLLVRGLTGARSEIAIATMFWNEPFSHRRNKDGTIDSICTRCYVTVGTALNESELPKIEHSHTCDPGWLLLWQPVIR